MIHESIPLSARIDVRRNQVDAAAGRRYVSSRRRLEEAYVITNNNAGLGVTTALISAGYIGRSLMITAGQDRRYIHGGRREGGVYD